MPSQSRISAWFAALVVLAGSVFLLEYVVFFNANSGGSSIVSGVGRVTATESWRAEGEHAVVAVDGEEEAAAVVVQEMRKLAVVVPAHAGDLDKALSSLATWPTNCHPSTLANADLVLYYAGGEADDVGAVLPALAKTGGRCFARTRLVLANLSEEENVYPKGASVQFYKLYLDPKVRAQLMDYHALAIIEWDVIVAHDTSFQKLYAAAFGGIEPFWIKGSTLEGVNFHETVVLPESRHVLGHINGNAIYNNTDPALVEFVNFTLTRWEYTQSYDVALWATIADFPYSWPLWQRYSRKFVAIDLIANVGFQDMDHHAISKAVAKETLFIHGSLTGGGGSMFHARGAVQTSAVLRFVGESNRPGERCTARCGAPPIDGAPAAAGDARETSTVCDRSCYDGGENGPRFGGHLCGAGDAEEFGAHCRWRRRSSRGRRTGGDGAEGEDMLTERRRHVIMCDTMMPPSSTPGCSPKCEVKTDTVCDRSCGTGRYGDYNCNWRGYGATCRFCFNDREEALMANDVARRRGGSVIMCHTFEPPTEDDDWKPPVTAGDDDGTLIEPNADGSDAEETERAPPQEITCVYTTSRGFFQMTSTDDEVPYNPSNEPYVKDITRGQICAFMTGFSSFLGETEVTVKSIIEFMPGMRIAIATQAADVSVFQRTLGHQPGVRVQEAVSPITLAALVADRHCGEDTKLIFYMNPGELLSRSFTSKDTHSAAGDLLVMYAEVSRIGEASVRRTLATMSVLGFSSPSFSFGMDIMLPVNVNQQLRDVLLSDPDAVRGKGRENMKQDVQAIRALGKFRGVFVPEVLAALAYSRNEAGLWFINPQQWVTHHMFQQASIWDIPLVKPRFGCAFDISMAAQGYDVAAALESQLGHFVSGSACERGFIPLDRASLRPKASIEFGFPTGREMPSISGRGLKVSVVFYASRRVSPTLLNASISSVVARFPEAHEVVVVFTEPPIKRTSLRDILRDQGKRSPFPIGAIEEDGPTETARGGWPGWSGLRADDHASGEFVMQLEVGDILVTDVTYENIFHFEKPVIPFKRLALGDGTGSSAGSDPFADKYIACGIEAIMEMDAVRDFALLRGLVYPRAAYTEMRLFAQEVHSVDIDSLVGQAHDSCEMMVRENGSTVGVSVGRGIFEASLLGSFMWRFMRDVVHWRALDPLDIQPNEWLSDVGNYNLLCSLGHLQEPKNDRQARDLAHVLDGVNSRETCDSFLFQSHFDR
ncbi:unnamed protein product [Scytosiphon promiscuus]